jgi:hypothetical protein
MPVKTIAAMTTEKTFREISRIATMQILTGNAKLLPLVLDTCNPAYVNARGDELTGRDVWYWRCS